MTVINSLTNFAEIAYSFYYLALKLR